MKKNKISGFEKDSAANKPKQDDPIKKAIQERSHIEKSIHEDEREKNFQEKKAQREALRREKKQAAKDKKKKKNRHYSYGVSVGILVIFFAVIGMITSVKWVYTKVYERVNDDSAERAYDTYLLPVVMLDPEPFENIDAADSTVILEAAIWKTMFDNLSNINVTYDDYARVILPSDLVEENAVALFGTKCILNPTDISLSNDSLAEGSEEQAIDFSNTIQYIAEDDTYHVPTKDIGSYQPYTVKISKKSNKRKLLRVGYVTIRSIDENESIDPYIIKYMEYQLAYDADTQQEYIESIRNYED